MYRDVLEVRSGILGDHHQDTLKSKHNLANVLQEQGKWQEAEDMHREVLKIINVESYRPYQQLHPLTLESMESLARAIAERDRRDWQFRNSIGEDVHFARLRDAIHHLRRSITEQMLRGDAEHPDLLKRRTYLAELLIQMNQKKDLKEAEDLLLTTAPALQKWYGSEHPLTLKAKGDLTFLLENNVEEIKKHVEELRQHHPPVEEEADAAGLATDEGPLESEGLPNAELSRALVGANVPHPQIQMMAPSASSSSEAAPSGHVSDATSSDRSAWLKAYEQKLLERQERKVAESEIELKVRTSRAAKVELTVHHEKMQQQE